ncbi:MAG: hypothetical protein WBG76_06575 [Ornithinimicrobium sp.]
MLLVWDENAWEDYQTAWTRQRRPEGDPQYGPGVSGATLRVSSRYRGSCAPFATVNDGRKLTPIDGRIWTPSGFGFDVLDVLIEGLVGGVEHCGELDGDAAGVCWAGCVGSSEGVAN